MVCVVRVPSGEVRGLGEQETVLTLEEMIFDVCTVILYSALPTVRVRTEPAFRLVMATERFLSQHIAHLRPRFVKRTNNGVDVREPHKHEVQYVSAPRI